MQRSSELQAMLADDEVEIADTRARQKQALGAVMIVLGGAALIYVVVLSPGTSPPDFPTTDEEFSTTRFRPPSFLRETEKTRPAEPQPVIRLPEPPEPPQVEPQPDVTPFNVPPPPPSETPVDSLDVGPEKPEPFPPRFLSKQIVIDNAPPQSAATDSNQEASDRPTVAGEDRSSKFLATAAAIADRSAGARRIARIDAVITEGTLIPAILETAIDSDLPGQTRAIVSKDVWSFDGRRLLVPTGTRLIGEYQSEIIRGQKRIFVVWTRLLRDDGITVRLNSIGADSLGRSGLTGLVDNKWRERFGSAILLSIVGAGSSYLTGYGSDQYGGGNSSTPSSDQGAELARETIATTFSDMANQALAENLKIAPTIRVPQGERLFVYVRQDLDFSSFYPDPVEQALKEIKHERGLAKDQNGR